MKKIILKTIVLVMMLSFFPVSMQQVNAQPAGWNPSATNAHLLTQKTSTMKTSMIPESKWIKLSSHPKGADMAAWHPDGKEIVYMTWDETSLGTVYKMKANGTDHTSLTITRVGYPHVSPDGTKIASGGFGQIWISNYDGTDHHAIYGKPGTIAEPGACYLASWSPDATKLAVVEWTSYTDLSHIITLDPDGTNPTNLTNGDQAHQYPCWSPEGTKIVYNRNNDIWIMDSDGQNQHRLTQYGDAFCPVLSSDGSIFFFRQPYTGTGEDRHIFRMDIDGTNVVQLTNSSGEWCPAISPDGEWMAFTAFDGNGVRNIYKAELVPRDLDSNTHADIWNEWWFWTILGLCLTNVVSAFYAFRYRRTTKESTKTATSKETKAARTTSYKPCPNCGAQLPTDAEFCGKCGESLK